VTRLRLCYPSGKRLKTQASLDTWKTAPVDLGCPSGTLRRTRLRRSGAWLPMIRWLPRILFVFANTAHYLTRFAGVYFVLLFSPLGFAWSAPTTTMKTATATETTTTDDRDAHGAVGVPPEPQAEDPGGECSAREDGQSARGHVCTYRPSHRAPPRHPVKHGW